MDFLARHRSEEIRLRRVPTAWTTMSPTEWAAPGTASLTLFTRRHTEIPIRLIEQLVALGFPVPVVSHRGSVYRFIWPDLSIEFKALARLDRLKRAAAMEGLIYMMYERVCPRGRGAIRRMHNATLGIDVTISPGFDDEKRARDIIRHVASALRSVISFRGSLRDATGRPLTDLEEAPEF